ncbi:MAG: membrane dipeptidase [Gammaproteobacteria bacterium]
MKHLKIALVALMASWPFGMVAAAPEARYGVVDRIPAPDGGFDYLSVDSARQRLFVGRGYGVMAVDLGSRTVINELLKADDVASVLIIPETDRMLVTAGGSNEAILMDRGTGAVQARIGTGKAPDAAFFEPASGVVFVMNSEDESATIIDLKRMRALATLPLGGKPEAGVSDGKGRAYVNIEDKAQIAVIDVAARQVVKRLALPGCVEPTGIAYDAATLTLISVCHNGVAKLIDARTGADRGSVPIGADADGAIFDPQRRLAYVPCDDGTLTLFRLDARAKPYIVAVVSTQPGARTAAVDPATGRIYLASRKTDVAGKRIPGTFNVLVVDRLPPAGGDFAARIDRVLMNTPLIDGHNDLPWEIRDRMEKNLPLDLRTDTSHILSSEGVVGLMTDIPRLRAGHVGAQFWSVWVPVKKQGFEAVQMTLEQIDVVKEMVHTYPADLEMAYTAADIRRIHKEGRVASLIGIEGGHQINASLPVLRQMYDAGARYMTLTHSTNTEWADSATDNPAHHGLTPFGVQIVREMNRIGMLVDLSHVSSETMSATLDVAVAPVMFSHSSARALLDHPRDVPDDVLKRVAQNGGIVMVNFYPAYLSVERNRWEADRAAEQARFSSPPYGGLYIGQPERAKVAMAAWDESHPMPPVTLAEVADHIEHIRRVAGVDHVGIGSDFDGIENTPQGLDGVDKYPALLAELMRRGWTDADIAKLAGENMLRVMTAVEAASVKLRKAHPEGSTVTIAQLDGWSGHDKP